MTDGLSLANMDAAAWAQYCIHVVSLVSRRECNRIQSDMRQHGFSLSEVLIVVAVVLIVVSVVIPRVLHTDVDADQSAAIGTVRAINRAEAAYASSHPQEGFICSLEQLGAAHPELLNRNMARGRESGYVLILTKCTGQPATSYFILAVPQKREAMRSFCSDRSGIIRSEPAPGSCTTKSVPLQ